MMRTAVDLLALASLAALVACSTAPVTTPAEASRGSGASTVAGAPNQRPAACVVLVANPSLSQAVLDAAMELPALRGTPANVVPGALPDCTIVVKFDSSVSQERQRRNLEGAIAGGLPSILLGAMVPWACATTHVLSATVLRADGSEIACEVVTEKQDTVGTMLWCPNVTEPSASLARKMAATAFAKLEQSGVLPAEGKPR
jgi:hypothetical protein